MKKSSVAAALAVALAFGASFAGPAQAATLHATQVLDANCGSTCGGPGRDDPTAALGAPDGHFYSLGLAGSAIFGFGQQFTGPGSVVEVTWGHVPSYPETADVYVGVFGSGAWTKVASVLNSDAQAGIEFDFFGAFDALKLVDTTPANCGYAPSCSGDGFDVDAVTATPIPLPAAGWLLLGGIGGLAALRRRKRAA